MRDMNVSERLNHACANYGGYKPWTDAGRPGLSVA